MIKTNTLTLTTSFQRHKNSVDNGLKASTGFNILNAAIDMNMMLTRKGPK